MCVVFFYIFVFLKEVSLAEHYLYRSSTTITTFLQDKKKKNPSSSSLSHLSVHRRLSQSGMIRSMEHMNNGVYG